MLNKVPPKQLTNCYLCNPIWEDSKRTFKLFKLKLNYSSFKLIELINRFILNNKLRRFPNVVEWLSSERIGTNQNLEFYLSRTSGTFHVCHMTSPPKQSHHLLHQVSNFYRSPAEIRLIMSLNDYRYLERSQTVHFKFFDRTILNFYRTKE